MKKQDEAGNLQPTLTTSSSESSTKLPLNRIKKIMQANKEIGKIQSNTPLVIAQALELFLADITRLASN